MTAREDSDNLVCVHGIYHKDICNSCEETYTKRTALKEQIGGNHYKKLKIQPIEFILANGLGFCEGNVVKYVTRWKDKNGIEDLNKALHYLQLLIEDETNKKQ